MNNAAFFKQLLIESTEAPSRTTIKNYVSDVRNFSRWYEEKYFRPFDMKLLHTEVLKSYMEDSSIAQTTKIRRIAALKKYYALYIQQGTVLPNPFVSFLREKEALKPVDIWNFKSFRSYLYSQKAAPLTVKNYLHDLQSFKKWLENAYPESEKNQPVITQGRIEEYKSRLIHVLMLSPRSVNRKLSSIRRYCEFANIAVLPIAQEPLKKTSLPRPTLELDQLVSPEVKRTYSSFLPLRISQYVWYGFNDLQDLIADPIAKKIRLNEQQTRTQQKKVTNIPKAFFDPTSLSTASLPWWKKIVFHARFTRPIWYRSYHSLNFSRYLHISILGVVIISIGLYLYQTILSPAKPSGNALGTTATAPTRTILYQGRLADRTGQPITSAQKVSFAVYYDPDDLDAHSLWSEDQIIHPNSDGVFKTALGSASPLPENLFTSSKTAYLGVAIGSGPELRPRQRLITTSNAANAERLADMPVINQAGVGTENVILALDSSGNLNIGGRENPRFQALDGEFTLSGNALYLETNIGSNGNIVLSPDGDGKIDVLRPFINSTDLGSVPGAVEVHDNLAIISADNNQSALTIDNNGLGDIITASSAGSTRFVVSREGFVGIGKENPGYELDIEGNANISGTIRLSGTTYRFPSSSGKEGDFLTTDGFGNLKWLYPASLQLGIWKTQAGAISPDNINSDFLLGGNSTASAKFAVLGLNSNSPTASLAGNLTFSGERIISTNNMNRLQIGDTQTGTISFQNNGNIGIGTSTPNSALHIAKQNSEVNLTLQNTSASSKKAQLRLSSSSPFGFWSVGTDLNGNNTDNFYIQGGTGNVARLVINSQGNMGVGTTNPSFKLHVSDSQSATAAALIENTHNGSDADGLAIKLGFTSTGSSGNSWVSFLDGNGVEHGKIRSNTDGTVNYQTTGADFAEYFQKANPLEQFSAGDVVCYTRGGVSKCSSTTLGIAGVVSQNPGFSGGTNGPDKVLVGLLGQLHINATDTSIKSGDPLAITNGKVIKAAAAGQIVGWALSDYENLSRTVMATVNPTWYDPDVLLTEVGELKTVQELSLSSINPVLEPNSRYIVTRGEEMIKRVAYLASATIGSLRVGLIEAQEIIVHGGIKAQTLVTQQLEITSDKVSVSGMSLKDYILAVVKDSGHLFEGMDGKPLAFANPISTDIISPVSQNSQISLDLSDSKLEIKNSKDASGSAVASIDNEGNVYAEGNVTARSASFSGSLTTDSLQTQTATIAGNLSAQNVHSEDSITARNASFSGTLSADSIVANSIQGLEEKVATIASEFMKKQRETESHSTDINNSTLPSNFALENIPTQFIDVATVSAGFALIHDGIVSFGPGTFRELTALDTFSIGTNFLFSAGSINTLGIDLEIQPLRQGNISLMAGAVIINTEGNLVVNGDADFQKNLRVHGTLATNTISPLDDQDLMVQLQKKNNGGGQEFQVTDGSKVSVFRVNDSGDVVSSGSALFARDIVASGAALLSKLNILARPVDAVSDTESIASGSAGFATLKVNRRQLTIYTPAVTENSLIYITPIGNTGNQVLYLERQVPGESFTVGISETARTDIKFNWMIVN